MRKYLAAVVQMDSQSDKEANLKTACSLIDEAAAVGARLVVLPEVMTYIGRSSETRAEEETIPGYSTEILSAKAKAHGIYLHCGSMRERNPQGGKFRNTSVVLSPQGNIIGVYRKMHTFDAILADGTVCAESANVEAGSEVVTVDTELGRLGLSICYDLRFPELFRLLALSGAQLLCVPANFTLQTGKDHWEPLLRARAIENGCYVLAPGQIGKKTKFPAFGNSLIVDPWGTVIARAKDEPGLAFAEIDLDYQDRVRSQLPSLKNRRADVYELRLKTEGKDS